MDETRQCFRRCCSLTQRGFSDTAGFDANFSLPATYDNLVNARFILKISSGFPFSFAHGDGGKTVKLSVSISSSCETAHRQSRQSSASFDRGVSSYPVSFITLFVTLAFLQASSVAFTLRFL